MFMFVLEVLDGVWPGPSGSGSFFTLLKKRTQSSPKRKSVSTSPAPSAPTPSPLSGPPPSSPSATAPSLEVLPLPLKYGNKHADKSTWDWDVAPGVVLVVMRDAPSSPLSTLVPAEFSASPVMLSQVEDILATSGMVQALHTQTNPPPASSPSTPSLNMEVDSDETPSALSQATSLNLW